MPAIVYKNAAGKRLPSVTTILKNIGWNTDALIFWANREGLEGRNCNEARDQAATIGTIAHAAIEADVKGAHFDVGALALNSDEQTKVNRCVEAWRAWREQTRLQIFASERSLVSETHQYGGTLDCAAVWTKRSILDLKTGSGIYAEALLQVAAYGALWNENYPDEPVEEYHIIRVGKEDGSFHHHRYDDLSIALQAFHHARALHELAKTLKKAA